MKEKGKWYSKRRAKNKLVKEEEKKLISKLVRGTAEGGELWEVTEGQSQTEIAL